MKVKKNNLIFIACIVWMVAGINVLYIGILEYAPYLVIKNILLSIIVFLAFQYFVFGKLVKKHTIRIKNYTEERQFFLKFFDVKSFIIMFSMITLGIVLRKSSVVSKEFIAVFYTGLGSSLLLAGILFGVNYIKTRLSNKNS